MTEFTTVHNLNLVSFLTVYTQESLSFGKFYSILSSFKFTVWLILNKDKFKISFNFIIFLITVMSKLIKYVFKSDLS